MTLWCFTLVSVTLIGIPPTSAFLSKWYLALGALESGIPTVRWLGPAVLLLSALLTAGYLLTVSIKAFLPGDGVSMESVEKHEPGIAMLLPMLVMTVLAVGLGIWPGALLEAVQGLAGLVF